MGRALVHNARLDVPAAKLEVPLLRHRTVRRARLLEWLDSAVASCRLTVVSGPPGAGRSTLLASWISDARAPARLAWVSLDRHDDSPAHFWSAVLVSLARQGINRSESPRALAAPPLALVTADIPIALAGALPNDGEPIVLVLDDLQDVRDQRVMDGLAELLRIAPPNFRMVISTRHDPRLPLPRLRVSGQLAEIRAASLAFTVDEARELLLGHGMSLAPSDVETLVQRTEGWAGALALTAMALKGTKDPSRQVNQIAGDERAVADYLATEILDGMTSDAREFLIRTSVVDRLSGSLADALTDGEGGVTVLAELERRNCFVVGLDERRQWYRYHRLFLDLLRSRLSTMPRAERRELYGRAARWMAEDGQGAEAIRYAISAQDWRFAADLVAEHWMDAFLAGRARSLRPLLEGIPSEFVEREPGVAVALAAIHLDAGDIAGADRYLELVRTLLADEPNERLAEQLSIVALLRARFHGDLEAAMRISDEVATARSRVESDSRGYEQSALVLLLLGATEVWTDRGPAAARHLREALAQARFGSQEYLALDCLGYLAIMEVAEGRLRAGIELAEQALAIAERRDWLDTPQVASALLALGWAQLLRCDPASSGTLDGALAAARASSDVPLQQATAAVRALAALDAEGPRRGLDILAAARTETGERAAPPLVDRQLRSVEVRLLLSLGEDAQALSRLDELPPSAIAAALWARHSLAHADPATAIDRLAPYAASDHADPDATARAEVLVLNAVARNRRLDERGASESLERAFALAGADESLWIFLQAGPSLRGLLLWQLRHGTSHRGLVESLLARLEQLEVAGGVSAEPLLEPLSNRERTLLSYLDTMLSTEEIASELFVSPNTVKSHTKSIYRKLGVSRRRQAVLRGRALRLL